MTLCHYVTANRLTISAKCVNVANRRQTGRPRDGEVCRNRRNRWRCAC